MDGNNGLVSCTKEQLEPQFEKRWSQTETEETQMFSSGVKHRSSVWPEDDDSSNIRAEFHVSVASSLQSSS